MQQMFKYVLVNLLLIGSILSASAQIPKKPNPPQLVNNLSKAFPDLISKGEAQELELKLEQFAEQTSNQIVVLIVDDLGGEEPWAYATEVIEQWGIGHEKEDNGIVILIKPTGGKGERKTFIATGRGLEGAIPDFTCKEIVENEMIPAFKEGKFYEGIAKASNVLMELAQGEYNSDQYAKKNKKKDDLGRVLIALGIIAFVLYIIYKNKNNGGGSGGFRSGGFYYGGFGGFGGGSSGGGFSGGGFGGFGGGSSGGGGAGGSW